MTDQELGQLLRQSFEQVQNAAPSRDLWASIAAHRERRVLPPSFDLALAAAILTIFLARPDWVVLAAYVF